MRFKTKLSNVFGVLMLEVNCAGDLKVNAKRLHKGKLKAKLPAGLFIFVIKSRV